MSPDFNVISKAKQAQGRRELRLILVSVNSTKPAGEVWECRSAEACMGGGEIWEEKGPRLKGPGRMMGGVLG